MSTPVFNATLTHREDLNATLAILRVVADAGTPPFTPGQYVALGLPQTAPRVAEAVPEDSDGGSTDRLIRRAYSIASSSRVGEYLEFYITLLPSGELTPRLFALRENDRLWIGPRVTGMFTLEDVPADQDVILLATGTGLAPYMSMLRTELVTGAATRRFVVVHGARHSWDLGYRSELESLARHYRSLTYLPAITRPQRDVSWKGCVGRLQQLVAEGIIEDAIGGPLDPARFDVFLCGNPAMIEEVGGIMEVRGFQRKHPRGGGNLHLEEYWK